MKIYKKTDQGGFTILEVLVSMIVLSVALLLLLNMAMVALDANDWSNNTTVATQALQEKIEELHSDHSKLTAGTDTLAGGVERTWTITKVNTNLSRIDVSVIWSSVRNDTITNTMSAFVRTDSL